MKFAKGYATEKDIIKIVAEKHGVTIKQAEYVYKFLCRRLNELSTDERFQAIKLPYIGILYRNRKRLKDYLVKNEVYTDKVSTLAKKSLAKINSYRQIDPKKGTISLKGIAHRKVPLIDHRFFGKFSSLAEYEKFTNTNNN